MSSRKDSTSSRYPHLAFGKHILLNPKSRVRTQSSSSPEDSNFARSSLQEAFAHKHGRDAYLDLRGSKGAGFFWRPRLMERSIQFSEQSRGAKCM